MIHEKHYIDICPLISKQDCELNNCSCLNHPTWLPWAIRYNLKLQQEAIFKFHDETMEPFMKKKLQEIIARKLTRYINQIKDKNGNI